jgi:hypothetical protein
MLATGFLLAGAAPSLANAATTFSSTGAEQTYTVPAGATQLAITAVGARGGANSFNGLPGGFGASVTDQVTVTPGELLYVEVGGNGGDTTGSYAAGGFNGGGASNNNGAGGGASDLRTQPSTAGGTLASRIVVAGGGGGAGNATNGGAGGVTAGSAGGSQGSTGGSGATTSGPGSGSSSGSGAVGGTASGSPQGGGGGGGYYGGGAGNCSFVTCAGGGAGSSWSANGNATISTDTTGIPEVTIAVVPTTPSNLTAPSVSGSDVVGATLTANPGTWMGPPASFNYQWQSCNSSGANCVAIPGATSATYIPTGSITGHTVQVEVTAVNTAGSVGAASAVTGLILSPPVNLTAPSITGTPTVGDTLTAANGSWSYSPTGYKYLWLDCNSSGTSCTEIPGATSASYVLTGTDAGHTVEVMVAATNSNGTSTLVASADTAAVSSATSTSTSTPATQGYAVTEPGTAVSAGLNATAQGMVDVMLQCPQVVAGVCDASGTLSIALNSKETLDREAWVALGNSVIAQFAGIQVQSGQQHLVATHLTPAAIAYLRSHGIYRVRVMLQITNTLTDGQTVQSSQETWLYVPGLTGCRAATGSFSSAGVGALRLGMSRRNAHRAGHFRHTANGFEHYCFAGGGIRTAYSSRAVASADRIKAGHVDLVLTGNRHYAVNGVHAGTTLKLARRRLALGRPLVRGKNTWYFIAGRKATEVLKVHGGVVREIGVALATTARTRAQAVYLLRHVK